MDIGPIEKCSVRIARALTIRGMKQAELCEKTKIPKSAISQYISGAFEPKQDRIFLISQALNVDPVWLMGYDVPMVKKDSPDNSELTEGDREILEVFRLIPEEERKALLAMGRAYANSLKKD